MSETLKAADEIGKKTIESLPGIAEGIRDLSANTADKLLKVIERETPSLLGEIVTLGQCSTIIQAGFAILFLLVCLLVAWKASSYFKHEAFGSSEFLTIISCLVFGFSVFIAFMIALYIVDNGVNFAKPFVAPRVYVLEYLSKLIK